MIKTNAEAVIGNLNLRICYNTNIMYYIYILSNKTNTTLYIGVTNNLVRRVWEHKNKFVKGFTKEYNLQKLVYFEQCGDVTRAIEREKQLKAWHRSWKNRLIANQNPSWKDLYPIICK